MAMLALMGFETSEGGATPVATVFTLELELFARAVHFCLSDYFGYGGVQAYGEGH